MPSTTPATSGADVQYSHQACATGGGDRGEATRRGARRCTPPCRSPCALRCPVASGHGSRDSARAPDEDLTAWASRRLPMSNSCPAHVAAEGSLEQRGGSELGARVPAAACMIALPRFLLSETETWIDMLRGMRVAWRGRPRGEVHGYAGQTAARCCISHC
jgi:hypothetical protein